MEFDAAAQMFVVEANELLEDMETRLLGYDSATDVRECVDAMFRAVHTIKGNAGLFGFDALVQFAHTLETLMDEVREGKVELTGELRQRLLQCVDHLGLLVDAYAQGGTPPEHLLRAGAVLLERLSGVPLQPLAAGKTSAPVTSQGEHVWKIDAQFKEDSLRAGMDPLPIIQYLAGMGTVEALVVDFDRLPELDAVDPEACYLGFVMQLRSSAPPAQVEGAFEFVGDLCATTITLLPEASPVADDDGMAEAAPGVRFAADMQTLRVSSGKLDQLVDLIGELVISAAGAGLAAHRHGAADLIEHFGAVSHLLEEVRDTALSLRMVPIGGAFGRLQRIVHEAARVLGKEIRLVTEGGDTELDKTLVERMADPLMHLVRNAVDHGIEAPEVRKAHGKPAEGTITLRASQEAGNVVIELVDDGKGLDRARILHKAIERGLVGEDAQLTDSEIDHLIFEPGFSTAESVTELSGRGVGMDVVKRNLVSLRGAIEVGTEPGAGTRFKLRLPLTAAIIDGFLVRVGTKAFVVPLHLVTECVETPQRGQQDWMSLRGRILPYLRLDAHFGIAADPRKRSNVVVVQYGDRSAGLAVDELLGEFQAVIKPLGQLFSSVEGLAGATILGNGELALVLDIPRLLDQVGQQRLDAVAAAGESAVQGTVTGL